MVFGFVKDGDGVSSQNQSQRRKGENKEESYLFQMKRKEGLNTR